MVNLNFLLAKISGHATIILSYYILTNKRVGMLIYFTKLGNHLLLGQGFHPKPSIFPLLAWRTHALKVESGIGVMSSSV